MLLKASVAATSVGAARSVSTHMRTRREGRRADDEEQMECTHIAELHRPPRCRGCRHETWHGTCGYLSEEDSSNPRHPPSGPDESDHDSDFEVRSQVLGARAKLLGFAGAINHVAAQRAEEDAAGAGKAQQLAISTAMLQAALLSDMA